MQLTLNSKQISIGAMLGMQSLLLFGTLAVAQIPVPAKPPVVPPRPAVKPPAPKPAAPAPKPATIPAPRPVTVPATPAAKPGTAPATTAPVVPPARPPITGVRPPIGGRPQVVPAVANSGVPGRQAVGGQGFNGRPPISGLAGQRGAASAGGASGSQATGSQASGSQAAGGSRAGVGGGNGQSLGSFPGCCGYTMTAYSCFRSGSQVLCDFDVSNQGNIRANAKQIYGDTHMVNGSGRVLPRTDAYFVDTDGSQFVDSQITPGNKVRMIMVFNNIPASTTSVSLAQGSNTIQSVPIANQEPGTADSAGDASHGAGQAGGSSKAKQQ